MIACRQKERREWFFGGVKFLIGATPHYQHKTNKCTFLKYQLNAKILEINKICATKNCSRVNIATKLKKTIILFREMT